MAEWAVMQETLELDGIDPYVALNLEQWLRDEALPDLRTQGVGVQVSPYVHEIIAMTIFGNRAEVLQVYRGSSGTYYDVETGELRYGTTPDDSAFRGDVSYTYAQWHRIDGRWTEVGATFSADSALTPAEWAHRAVPAAGAICRAVGGRPGTGIGRPRRREVNYPHHEAHPADVRAGDSGHYGRRRHPVCAASAARTR